MRNHFHLLLRVPERVKILRRFETGTKLEREDRLFEHLKLLYSKAHLEQLKGELEVMTEKKMSALYEKTIQGYLARLCSLEHFMKELKERFSRWFNKRHGRWGTLWQPPSPKTSSAKGMEAGDEVKAKEKRQGRKYRRRGVDREKALAELRDGKSLSKADLLRCRVRYFSDGLVLGSREFVEKAFEEKRGWFGPKRKTGARGLPVDGGKLFALRDLKVRALE